MGAFVVLYLVALLYVAVNVVCVAIVFFVARRTGWAGALLSWIVVSVLVPQLVVLRQGGPLRHWAFAQFATIMFAVTLAPPAHGSS